MRGRRMALTMTFPGVAGTLPGSKYTLHNGHALQVDCGLFHGLKELRLQAELS
jgi:hypothetical protein